MILGAALLVLAGLALFVGGILTGRSAYFWLSVLACGAAGVLLVLARLRLDRPPPGEHSGAPTSPQGSAGAASAAGTSSSPSSAPSRPADDVPEAVEPAASPTEHPERAEPPAQRVHHVAWPENLRGDPPVEDVEVTDLLLVLDLRDEVLVVDEHPRYHLPGCRWLGGRETIPLPLDEARTDGFTPCGTCAPDRHLAERARARKSAGS